MGWNRDARVTAAEAATLLPGLTRHAVYMWVQSGKLAPVGKRGRSPLYRWGDLVDVECSTRMSVRSSRNLDLQPAAA